jgi:hypothetical protein
MCEIIAANFEESWSPAKLKVNRRLSSKRMKEVDPQCSKTSKKHLSETREDQSIIGTTDTQLDANCAGTTSKSDKEHEIVNESEAMLSESIPSSPRVSQHEDKCSQQQNPLDAAVDNSQQEPNIFQTSAGPKIFVSEMLINQRQLYLELETRFKANSKLEICETSLELPDIAFSSTSCALVFSSSELWNNIQVRI